MNQPELGGQQTPFYLTHPAQENGAGQNRPHVSVEHGADKAMSAENPRIGGIASKTKGFFFFFQVASERAPLPSHASSDLGVF